MKIFDNANSEEKGSCELALAQAPVVNGLRLRMTRKEVLALFPGSNEDAQVHADLSRVASPLGTSSFMIRPAAYESKNKYAGINQIAFTLLDGRVSSFSIGYDGPEWSHVDGFVTKFTQGTNLPAAEAWQPYVGMDNNLKILKCVDFEIRVFAYGKGGNLNYVLMTDLSADKELKDRRAKARAKATLESNPQG